MSFTVLVPVGPGEKEVLRLRDLMDSLFFYEPTCAEVVVVGDAISAPTEEIRSMLPPTAILSVITNPRNGQGNGWSDGLGVALFAGLNHIISTSDPHFVLRLDTDALVIGPFVSRIKSKIELHPGCGQLGTFRLYPSGSPRIKTEAIFLIDRQTHLYKAFRFLVSLLVRANAPGHITRSVQRRQLILQAVRNGYRVGEFVQGGGYVISRELLQKLRNVSWLDDDLLFLHTAIGEDVVATILCHAVGLHPIDFNQEGQVFGVSHVGLAASPEELMRRQYAIVHSIKTTQHITEDTIREFFRKRRNAAS